MIAAWNPPPGMVGMHSRCGGPIIDNGLGVVYCSWCGKIDPTPYRHTKKEKK